MTDSRTPATTNLPAEIGGVGLGLRSQHYPDILRTRPAIPWFEALSENYMSAGGPALYHLEQIRQNYPVTLHGVGMSLGSADDLDHAYLDKLQALIDRFEPALVSDHLAWISTDSQYLHDLLPVPYTAATLEHIAKKIERAQEYLGRRLLIENPSSYLTFSDDEMSEWQFMAALAERADCYLLLDLNNLYVSATNQAVDPTDWLQLVPAERVREIHLAGYEDKDDYLFDTHGYPVHPPVWELYEQTIRAIGPRPTLIEWDTDIPSFERLMQEARTAELALARLAA